MAGSLPLRINPFLLTAQDTYLQGAVPIALMPRLQEALISYEGEAKILLAFTRDDRSLDIVTGEVCALLEMQCQRCLRSVEKAIKRHFRLAIVRDDAEALRLQTEHEILEVQDETVFTRDLVEDELILSLPLVPTHDDPQACDAAIVEKLNKPWAEPHHDKQRTTGNPFAVLKHLNKAEKN